MEAPRKIDPATTMETLISLLTNYWPFWVGLAVLVAIVLLLRMYGGERPLPYRKRESLLTKAELRFYRSLIKAAQDDFQVFAMVRMADLLQVEPGNTANRKWLNSILAKHIDFVLCDNEHLKPLVCIELDDSSHARADRIERDIFVNKAMESAKLPLLRIKTQTHYHAGQLRELINKTLEE